LRKTLEFFRSFRFFRLNRFFGFKPGHPKLCFLGLFGGTNSDGARSRSRLANAGHAAYSQTMTCKLTAIIEQDKDGVFAYCPELKGCHTQGDTVEEALANLREAAELFLETLKPVERRRLNAKTIFATSLEIVHA
jgi:predicted RNase H-like HicB family nuclease